MISRRMALACGTAIIALSSPAVAQDAPATEQETVDATETEENDGIQDIVVTAQRRSENLQNVPISVTAFGSELVEAARIQSFGDLSSRIPGFSVNTFSQSRANPTLRGGGTSLTAPGAEQAVGLFIDDVYYGGSGDFEIDLFDVERIEVLKGPQGTLFGRNTTGGLINVVTKTPSDTFEGKLEASLGNYKYVQLRGYITGPLGPDLSGSLAFTSTDRGGTSLNITTGNRVDVLNKASLRGKLKWDASDTLSVVLGLGYTRNDETAPARESLFPNIPIENQALLATGFVPDSQPRLVQMWTDGRFESEQFTGSLHITKNLSGGDLLSITSYRHMESKNSPISLAGVPIPIYDFGEPRSIDAASQEFRYVSKLDGPLNFVGGAFLYYANESRLIDGIAFWEANTAGGFFQSATLCPEQNFALYPASVDPQCVALHPELFQPAYFTVFQRTKTKSASAFLQGTYNLLDSVSLTLGGRYTYDKKSTVGNSRGDFEFFWHPVDVDVNDSRGWGKFTYRAALDWKVTDRILAYVSRSTGFRSGAYEVTQSNPAASGVPVNPESVLSHEIGLKTRLFDNHVQLNIAAFHAKYTDLQFFVNAGGSNSITTNAGEATVKGIEVDAVVQPFDGLSLSAAYSYQKGSSKGIPAAAGIPDGTPPAGTVPHTISVAADYEHQYDNGSALSFHVDLTHKDQYNLEFTNNIQQTQSRIKSQINASVGYKFSNSLELRLWGKNLTNENVITYGQDFWFSFYSLATIGSNPAAFTDTSQPRYADPRTYGATLSFTF
jgi:iron complex outermembrane recepter protein